MAQYKDERSLGELFQEFTQETSTLVRQEIALARAELTQTAQQVGKDVGLIAAGGVIAYAGFIVILGGLAILLGDVMPLWLATLLVGLVVAGAGGGLVLKGKNDLQSLDPTPQRTVDTLKKDKEWVKDQAR